MTTYAEAETHTTSWPMFAALGTGISMVLTALGTFVDLTGNESGPNDGLQEYLPAVGVTVVAALIVFGLVVRGATADNGATRALVLSIIGFLSLVIFWAGLPAVLAAAAVSCALVAHPRGGMAKAAIGVSALTVALAIVAAIAG